MNELLQSGTPEVDWAKLRPVLDRVMHKLKASDREVILMRFFENRPLAEIGRVLGLSEDTARKRVDRALGKLRLILVRQGFNEAVALGTLLSAHAAPAAPAGLAAAMAGGRNGWRIDGRRNGGAGNDLRIYKGDDNDKTSNQHGWPSGGGGIIGSVGHSAAAPRRPHAGT
jgi:DNA-binding CsgD family transcriptional regulator